MLLLSLRSMVPTAKKCLGKLLKINHHGIVVVVGDGCCGYTGKVHVEYVDGTVYHCDKDVVELVDENVSIDDLLQPCDVVGAASEVESQDHSDEELCPAEATKFRAIAARLNYMAVDRVDIQYAVKEVARHMSTPTQAGWQKLVKIGRYLIGRPRLVSEFKWQVQPTLVTAYADSDWAGCVKSAKSTSGGIICIGTHVVKTYSRQQRVIALSSAEAELYAMVAASAEAIAISSYAKDLGLDLSGEVFTDSSAALGIAQRAGIGKVRHLRTQGLWVQEARVSGRLC